MRLIGLTLLIAAVSLTAACSRFGHHEEPVPKTTMNHNHEMMQMNHGGHVAFDSPKIKTIAAWKLSDENPQPGKTTTITVQIDDERGKPVKEFDINHEKQMHLIVVSRDLASFDHIHPVYNGNGQFQVKTAFPAAGDYKLIADYMPAGGSAVNNSTWVAVRGTASKAVPVEPDKILVKTVNGVKVELTYDHLMAGMDLELTFHLTDARSHEPIKDLEPYLGAVGHVVILNSEVQKYLHVHPMEEKAGGPDAKFMTSFPEGGIYKVWGEFKRKGETFLVPFVIKVP
ncbi:hypothetical protein [Paenibacillus nasutitermitis]|uniref:YtkA-like domain-containing protein n=1 Tax=Paenibacillus nasutitermitis TaxID=1652958 RepID=A0A916YXW4_9BACL|nr:hypothetical protein [Paenibacillus nasutitermitis]GGD65806.1 hypothetical protein GCM10010911_24470 [Paenibacillus nasutitermitis]